MPDLFVSPHSQPLSNPPTDGHVPGFLHTYCEFPKGVTFENQDEKEHILLFLRRHFATNIPWIFISIIFIFLPIAFPVIVANLPGLLEIPPDFGIILLSFYYLLIAGYILINFISWFYNISLVTDTEVVDIDYTNVTHKNIAATLLDEIQDAEYTQSGFLRTFFDYGDVMIQTAGAHPNLEFYRVPHPGKVTDIIIDAKKRKKHV